MSISFKELVSGKRVEKYTKAAENGLRIKGVTAIGSPQSFETNVDFNTGWGLLVASGRVWEWESFKNGEKENKVGLFNGKHVTNIYGFDEGEKLQCMMMLYESLLGKEYHLWGYFSNSVTKDVEAEAVEHAIEIVRELHGLKNATIVTHTPKHHYSYAQNH